MRYAISDIHGCANTFRHLVNEVIQLKSTDELFLLGDYIDRGADSKGVIDFIQELQKSGIQVRTLSGNHEAMMLDAREDPEYFNHWMLNGGKQTLASFGVKSIRDIPQSYWLFLLHLEYYIELEDYLLVHAGFNFKAEDPFTDTHSMLWIRNFPVDKEFLGNRKIVHGHTPTPMQKIAQSVKSKAQVINIDGGCVYTSRMSGLGYLTALNLDTLEFYSVPNQD